MNHSGFIETSLGKESQGWFGFESPNSDISITAEKPNVNYQENLRSAALEAPSAHGSFDVYRRPLLS
jgi:hypothetical protein